MKDSGLLKLKTFGIYASMKVTTKQDEADPDFQFPTCCIGVRVQSQDYPSHEQFRDSIWKVEALLSYVYVRKFFKGK